jgi:hypothetical protein
MFIEWAALCKHHQTFYIHFTNIDSDWIYDYTLDRVKMILKDVKHCHHDNWFPVTMAKHVLRLQMEEWPPDTECSCEYIE